MKIYARITLGEKTVTLKDATTERIEKVKAMLYSGIPVVTIEDELKKFSLDKIEA